MTARERCDSHILFVGFMGSGKTSVSRRLSSITGLSLIDLDQRICALEHKSIPKIFDEVGEEGFREIETSTLAGIAFEGKSIVGCGGGVVCNPANRALLKTLGTVVYLKVPLEESIRRISHPETRPLLSGPRPVEEIYAERQPLYAEVADITVESAGMSVADVAQLCKSRLEERDAL